MGLLDFSTKTKTNLLEILLLFMFLISHFSVITSITIIDYHEGFPGSAKQPSSLVREVFTSPLNDADPMKTKSDSLLEKPLLEPKRKAGRAVHHSEKTSNVLAGDDNLGFVDSRYSDRVSASTVDVVDERSETQDGGMDGSEPTTSISFQEPSYLGETSWRIWSSLDDKNSSSKNIVRTARRVPRNPGEWGPEPYFFGDDDEAPGRETRKKKTEKKDKPFSSSSSFFSMGSQRRDSTKDNKRSSEPQTVALIVTPGSLASLLGNQNSETNSDFRNLEEKIKSYERNTGRSRESPQIVKLNQEKFFTDAANKFVSNSHTGKSGGRKHHREDSLHNIGFERKKPQNDRKRPKAQADTATLPPFLKVLDVPLHSLISDSSGDKFEFSKILSLFDAIPKEGVRGDKGFDFNSGNSSSPDSHLDSPKYRTSKFKKGDGKRSSFEVRNRHRDEEDWPESRRNNYDSSKSQDNKYRDSDYNRNRDYGSARSRNNDDYDTSGFRRNNGRTQSSRRDKNDYSDEDLPPLNFASLLDSYNERDKAKSSRGDGGRKSSSDYDSRYESSSEEEDNDFPSRGNFVNGFKKEDPSRPSKFGLSFSNESSVPRLFDFGINDKDNRKDNRLSERRNSALSLLEGLFNPKSEDRDKTNEKAYSNKSKSGSSQSDKENTKDENKKSLAELLDSFNLSSKVDGDDEKSIKQFTIPSRVEPFKDQIEYDGKTTKSKEDLTKDVKQDSMYSTARPQSFKDVTENSEKLGTSPFALKPTKIPDEFVGTTTKGKAENSLTRTNSGLTGLNIPSFPISPMSHGGSPVIINSTFYVTTASPLHLPSPIDYIPRLRTPAFFPLQDIQKNANSGSDGNRFVFINPGPNPALRGLPVDGNFFGNLPSFPPGANTVSNKGLSGVSNPLQRYPNTNSHPSTTIFPTTRGIPNTSLPRSHPRSTAITTPFPVSRRPTTAHPNVGLPATPRLATPFPVNRPTSFSATPQVARPHPTLPFSVFSQPTTPFSRIPHPTTQHSVTPRPTDFLSITPNANVHLATTPRSPVQFSASPYPTTLLPGTLLPKIHSKVPQFLTTPLSSLSSFHDRGDSNALPPNSITFTPFPNVPHDRRFHIPTTLPLVTLESPVHQITKKVNNDRELSGKRLTSRRRLVKGKSRRDPASITTPISRQTTKPVLLTPTPQSIASPPSPPKVVRRLRKKKRRFKSRNSKSTPNGGDNKLQGRVPLATPDSYLRLRQNTGFEEEHKQFDSFNIRRHPTTSSRLPAVGPMLHEPSPVIINHPIINHVSAIPRVKKPTKPPLPFFTAGQPSVSPGPFFTTISQPLHRFLHVTTPLPSFGSVIAPSGTPISHLRNHVPGTHSAPKSVSVLESPSRGTPSPLISSGTPLPQRVIHSENSKPRKFFSNIRNSPHKLLSLDISSLPQTFREKPPNAPFAVHPFPPNILLNSNFPKSPFFLSSPSPNHLSGHPISRLVQGAPTPRVPRLITGTQTPRVSGLIIGAPGPTPIIGTPTPTPFIGTPTPTPLIRKPTPTPIIGTPVPRGVSDIPLEGTPKPRIKGKGKQPKPHVPHHRRKLIQDIPIPSIIHGIMPYYTGYGSVLLDPRTQSLPQSLLSAAHPSIRLNLSGHPSIPSEQEGSFYSHSGHPITSSFPYHPAMISSHLARGTPSSYYARNSFPLPGSGIPINGLSPLHGGSPILRNYYVRKSFKGHPHKRDG